MDPILTNIRYGGYLHGLSVVADAPIGVEQDKLQFRRYVDALVAVLTDRDQETPFTIGIFGPWGSGKSSLLRMLSERLGDSHPDEFVRVEFNAWVHRREPNILVPLLHTLRDALAADAQGRFLEAVSRLGTVLITLGADLALKGLTAGHVSLEQLEKLEKAYLERRFAADSEMRRLRTTLQAEIAGVHKKGAKLVILVDDLDRCDPDQIVALLDAIKLFLDFQHVFVVLAVDREVVRRGIQVRYKEFQFADGRSDVIGHEYLEKMVQLPVELFPLSPTQIGALIGEVLPGDAQEAVRTLITSVAIPNARKIKRLVNIFAVVQALMLADESLKTLDRVTVLRLIALQVQYPELYWKVVTVPDALEAMEKRYAGSMKSEAEFQVYGARATSIKEICDTFYVDGSPLMGVFTGSKFSAVKKDLPRYLSLLGGLGG